MYVCVCVKTSVSGGEFNKFSISLVRRSFVCVRQYNYKNFLQVFSRSLSLSLSEDHCIAVLSSLLLVSVST